MILPKGAIRVSQLSVVEYMTTDGELHIESEAFDSANEELSFEKTLELLEIAKCKAVAPFLAHEVAQYCLEDVGEDE